MEMIYLLREEEEEVTIIMAFRLLELQLRQAMEQLLLIHMLMEVVDRYTREEDVQLALIMHVKVPSIKEARGLRVEEEDTMEEEQRIWTQVLYV